MVIQIVVRRGTEGLIVLALVDRGTLDYNYCKTAAQRELVLGESLEVRRGLDGGGDERTTFPRDIDEVGRM